jgi:hypothetical protein
LDRKKNAAIPAIRARVNGKLIVKMAVFGRFLQLSACFLCQVCLFHFREKSRLKAGPDNLKQEFPGANPRRGQERKEPLGARLGLRATGSFCLSVWGSFKGGASQCKAEGQIRLSS